MQVEHDERGRQIAIGGGVILLLGCMATVFLVGSLFLTGVLGEWVGVIAGIVTTPFFLEGSLAVVGLLTVLFINGLRRHMEGDEFVYLEQVESPANSLPDQAKWAIYRNAPLAAGDPTLLVQAEGAFEIGEFDVATQAIGMMDGRELNDPETLALRFKLAKATGRTELAMELERQINRGAE